MFVGVLLLSLAPAIRAQTLESASVTGPAFIPIAVPQTLDELTAAAVAVQEAERGAGNEDFYLKYLAQRGVLGRGPRLRGRAP